MPVPRLRLEHLLLDLGSLVGVILTVIIPMLCCILCIILLVRHCVRLPIVDKGKLTIQSNLSVRKVMVQ